MQYILTEEEYKNRIPKFIYEEKLKEIEELQRLVMKISGHTCIYYNMMGDFNAIYCDSCPLADFDCGKRKEFSK